MDQNQNILQYLTSLPKFRSGVSKKSYFISHTIPYEKVIKLIDLARQTKQFIIQTKRYDKKKYPALIQILFSQEQTLHIILIETMHLPSEDLIKFKKIQHLLYIILLRSNTIYSWKNIKHELHLFLKLKLFLSHQIEDMRAIHVKDQLANWLHETFDKIPYYGWNLKTAIAYMFMEALDASPIDSDWNIGFYREVRPDHYGGLIPNGPAIIIVPKPDPYRIKYIKYAIHECVAVNKIVSFFENPWTRQHVELFLKMNSYVLPPYKTVSPSISNVD
ncbi:unnamed protein product [Adineta steineri]|uniref:Uncharacterized protein n=1 Tax=Adineta steineri TaxID=433720 RepID=A0A815LYB0_9BILA|nr:unnamed protein product [Adineta steineri]CAF3764641.1 unnamed protein product [Adineta steineri]